MEVLFPIKRRKGGTGAGRLNWIFCKFNQYGDMKARKGSTFIDIASENAMREWKKQMAPLDALKILPQDFA